MLNVTNTLAIGPFLDVFMLPIGGNDRSRAVARCIWVKNPYVKICILCSSPEPSGPKYKLGYVKRGSTAFKVPKDGCGVQSAARALLGPEGLLMR